MTVTKKYSTARAFRVALEARLKQIADNEKIDLHASGAWLPLIAFLQEYFKTKQNDGSSKVVMRWS